MVATPLDKTEAVLAARATTDKPTRIGGAATSERAVTVAGLVIDPKKTDGCDPSVKDITKLPAVMENKGFDRGAKLLKKWLASDASVNPIFSATDTTTISMEFVLTHPRARKEFDGIFSEKKYLSQKAREQIEKLLKRMGKDKSGHFDFYKPVEELDPGPSVASYTIQTIPVGSLTDPIDSLTASLGRFVFKVVVAGHVDPDPTSGRRRVTITEVGVHVEDRYDFEGLQPLGCWNICTNEVGRVACGGGSFYTNADFRDFRQKTGKGGDIWVLSDVKGKKLDPPESFLLP